MLLEDRLLMILEGRLAGKPDEDISQSMGLEVKIIGKYEKYLKERINENRKCTVRKIANRIGVSPLIVDMAREIYGLKIEPLRNIAIERIAQVQALYSEGKSATEISALLGLKVNTIHAYHRIFLRSKENQKKIGGFALKKHASYASYKSKEEDIFEAAKLYVRVADIALLTEASERYVSYILGKLGTQEERKVKVIKNAFEEGVSSIDELCVRAGVKDWQYLRKFCEKHSLPFPETHQEISIYPRRLEYDKMIAEGATLQEIGEKNDVTKECVRQYIMRSGQYEHYRELRKLKTLKVREEPYHRLSGLVKLILQEKAEIEPWAVKKAVNYFLRVKHESKNSSFEKILEVFKVYEEAKNKGEKQGLWKLGKRVGLAGTTYWRILKLGGVEPMYGSIENRVPKNYRMKACLRGVKTHLLDYDIAYFLGLPKHLPSLRYRQKGISKEQGGLFRDLEKYKITYRLASQIYEARNAGFKRNEIAELCNLNQKIVDYVIEDRRELEKKIVNELRILFNDKKVKRPYVTPRMKNNLEPEG